MTLLVLADVLLLAGLTARVSRFFTADYLGDWWVVGPLSAKAAARDARWHGGFKSPTHRYVTHLFDCPFCIGFWVAVGTTISLLLAGGAGDASQWWRWVAGAFTLNYVVGHLSARLDE